MRNIKETTLSLEYFLLNYPRIAHYMNVSLDVFPRVYNPIKEWVTSDEAYPRYCYIYIPYSTSYICLEILLIIDLPTLVYFHIYPLFLYCKSYVVMTVTHHVISSSLI